MTEKKTTPNPEELTEEERQALLRRGFERSKREFQNEIIARELAREDQDERRDAS